jgi:hypothetical protein
MELLCLEIKLMFFDSKFHSTPGAYSNITGQGIPVNFKILLTFKNHQYLRQQQ